MLTDIHVPGSFANLLISFYINIFLMQFPFNPEMFSLYKNHLAYYETNHQHIKT